MLFYHVSAVKIFDHQQITRFISESESRYGFTDCQWVSEVMIQIKVITLFCITPDSVNRFVHLDEKMTILSKLDPVLVNYPQAKVAFSQLTGINQFAMSLTLYKGKSVYWVNTATSEWLLNLSDYSILWKVDKNDD